MTEERAWPTTEGVKAIDDYPNGTALIHFTLRGNCYQWAVGATGNETAEEMKQHLERWVAGAQFVSVDMKTLAGVVIKR